MNKKIKSILVVSSISFLASGCIGNNSTPSTPVVTSVKTLNPPPIAHVDADISKEFDTNISNWNEVQWLALANQYYKKGDYAKSLRAAEKSIAIRDTIEAREIATLSSIIMAKSNIGSYAKNGQISDDYRDELKDRLNTITSTISTARQNAN